MVRNASRIAPWRSTPGATLTDKKVLAGRLERASSASRIATASSWAPQPWACAASNQSAGEVTAWPGNRSRAS